MNRSKVAGIVALVVVLWVAGTWLVLRIYDAAQTLRWKIAGYKTYIIGGAYIAHAVLGWWLGDLDAQHCSDRVLEGLGAMSLRAGAAKVGLPPPAAQPEPQKQRAGA